MSANAVMIEFQSSQRQVSLLELYTSEGCSSCPPAEAWLSKLKNSQGLWDEFVPVAFHVDYWDNLGWKDRFSDEQYTERQKSYAQLWSASDIYTPEFVLNGKECTIGLGFVALLPAQQPSLAYCKFDPTMASIGKQLFRPGRLKMPTMKLLPPCWPVTWVLMSAQVKIRAGI
jgi:Protein of unknown function (DUF1223)